MIELLPVSGYLVADHDASSVIAPAYDTLDPEQRRAHVRAHPESFLGALPTGEVDATTLGDNRRAWDRLLAAGRFRSLDGPSLLVLELVEHGRRLTAVVGDIDVRHYLDGSIRPHEHVRPDRVADLARYLDDVEVASSPVCVLHRPAPDLADAVSGIRAGAPSVDVELEDGAGVRVWTVGPGPEQEAVLRATRLLAELTIADGHHRAAAVAFRDSSVADQRRVLTALVSADDLWVEPFHRRIDGLAGVTPEEVAAVLTDRGLPMESLPGPSAPPERGTIHLTVGGRWWSVSIGDRGGPGPLGSLDAHVVEREVIAPVSALAARPEGARVVAVPGPRGLDALTGRDAVGIALTPPRIDELLAVIAAGEVLPHKSTYLVPKLRSGVVVVPR